MARLLVTAHSVTSCLQAEPLITGSSRQLHKPTACCACACSLPAWLLRSGHNQLGGALAWGRPCCHPACAKLPIPLSRMHPSSSATIGQASLHAVASLALSLHQPASQHRCCSPAPSAQAAACLAAACSCYVLLLCSCLHGTNALQAQDDAHANGVAGSAHGQGVNHGETCSRRSTIVQSPRQYCQETHQLQRRAALSCRAWTHAS